MTEDKRNDLGEIIRRQRVIISLTLKELAYASGVSSSHLGRIERGNRFPSARILHKIARPLNFDEHKLFALAGYLPPQTPAVVESSSGGQLDPYVAMVLTQEPVEVQRAVVTILSVLKSMAKANDSNIDFAEYAHKKYPELNKDTITMIEDILEHPPGDNVLRLE